MMAISRTNSEEEIEKLCQLILPLIKLQHGDQKAVEIDYNSIAKDWVIPQNWNLKLKLWGPSEEQFIGSGVKTLKSLIQIKNGEYRDMPLKYILKNVLQNSKVSYKTVISFQPISSQ